MTHDDHLALLRDGIGPGGGMWADLGSGAGTFTIALAELLHGRGRILSVDLDSRTLAEQERLLRARFPKIDFSMRHADFTVLSGISDLDGIVMANSLHFQRDAESVLRKVISWLAPGGRLLVVEYDIGLPNPWVPYPVPFKSLVVLASAAGFTPACLLETRPSRYHRRVYSAVTQRPSA